MVPVTNIPASAAAKCKRLADKQLLDELGGIVLHINGSIVALETAKRLIKAHPILSLVSACACEL